MEEEYWGSKSREVRGKREMRPLSFYLPAVRDQFLKKTLIRRQLQINHSGCIFKMKSCWEYPPQHMSLFTPTTPKPQFPYCSISNENHFGRGDILFWMTLTKNQLKAFFYLFSLFIFDNQNTIWKVLYSVLLELYTLNYLKTVICNFLTFGQKGNQMLGNWKGFVICNL